MKSPCLPLIVVVLAVICSPQTGFGADDIFVQQPMTYSGPDYMPGQIIVKFRPGVGESVIAQINENNNANVAYRSRFADFRVLTFPETVPPQAMVNIYARNPNVEYAELNYIAHIFGAPNDPYYRYQWHLDNATHGGIGMEEAWPLSTGAGVTVAVVDTGVKLGGPDGVPASGGYDFVNGDSNPDDDNGHGTHVAGTIAQNTNNGKGVAGVAYDCSILPVKVLNRYGSGTYAQIADGIRYAADNGAKVINMSLGGSSSNSTLENAIAYAYNMGVTIVCAAGNDGASQVSYPARYDAYCIAVGATRYDETLASYSNYGSSLDLTAPGGDTSVDQNGDGYGDGVLQETFQKGKWGYWFFQGTSMAAPHVSGVAALVISEGIASSPAEVRNVLQSTAKDKGAAGRDDTYGWGIVDAYRALGGGANKPPTAGFTYSATDLTVTFTDTSTDSDGTVRAWSWNFGDGQSSTEQNPSHTYASSATYTVTLTVTDDDGATNTAFQSVTVTQTTTNTPPVASFSYRPTDLTVIFTDTSRDSDGTVTAWSWDFGDRTTPSTEQSPTHTYASSGTYTVTLTVRDDDGATNTTSQSVTVTASSTVSELFVFLPSEMAFTQRKAGPNYFVTASVLVQVVDKGGGGVEGATVTGQWSGNAGNLASGVTGSGGFVELVSSEVKTRASSLTFTLTVTSVEKSGWTYNDIDPWLTDTWNSPGSKSFGF